MKQIFSLLVIVLITIISCNKRIKVEKKSQTNDTLIANGNIVSTINVTLIPLAKKDISKWQQYIDVDDFILKYYNISTWEALENASELSGFVTQMKDSIKIEKLKALNVVARINVLQNETLRLKDMATISSIKNEEVDEEVKKIIQLFEALNAKINTIYKAEEIQSSIDVDTEEPVIEEKNVVRKPIKKLNNRVRLPLKNRPKIK